MTINDILNGRDDESVYYSDGAPHYYGNYIRVIFFVIGLLMLFCLPFFSKEITIGPFLSILGVIVINLLAGMTNRKQKVMMFFDIIVSLIGTLFFELIAFFRFDRYGNIFDAYFWFNEIVALLFFITLYLGIKTFRGMITEGRQRK